MIARQWRVAVGMGMAAVMLAAAGAGGQTSRPAGWPGEVADGWMGRLAMYRLAEAARTGEYGTLKEEMAQGLLARLAQGGTGNLEAINEVMYVIRACEYLPRTDALPEGRAFAQWLVANYQVSRLLFRAMADEKPKADGIAGMYEIWKAEPKLAGEYANLAVAFATASPQRVPGEQVEPVDAVRAFRWYARECRGARYEVKKMPYELSRYLACTRLSVAERNWAAANYGKENNPDRIYNALEYDWDHVRKGLPKKISALSFTLPNLKKVGGVCLERAYFSAEVMRAMAVPAVMVLGMGQRGGHAWLAVIQKTPGGRSVKWDAGTGRYADDKYFVGSVFDPVRGREMNDCELAISLAAQLLPLQQREWAASAVQAARMADEAVQAKDASQAAGGRMEALRRLAGQYNALLAGKGAASRPAESARWAGPAVAVGALASPRPLDEHLVEDLITQALNNNMVHNGAWEFVIDQGTKNRLPVERVGRFLDVLLKKTAGEYPDYGCSRSLRLIGTFQSLQQRAGLLDRAAKVFAHRPDLSGQILIAEGKVWVEQGKEKAGMASFEKAVQTGHKNAPGVVMDALRAIEEVYRGKNQLDAAIKVYYRCYQQAPKMDSNSPFRTASERYRLGMRLAELLKETGKVDAALRIAGELDPQAKKDKTGKKS